MPTRPKLDASMKARCLAELRAGDLVTVESSKRVERILEVQEAGLYLCQGAQPKAWAKINDIGPPF